MSGKNRLGIFLFCDAQGIVSDYVTYMLEDSEEWIEGTYPIELGKIDFYPFEPIE